MDIEKAANTLIELLKNTPEYKNLLSAKTVVNSNSKLKSLIDGLDKKQNYLYSAQLSENDMISLSQELKTDYDKLSQIDEAKKYFDASERFGVYLSNILSNVAKALKQ